MGALPDRLFRKFVEEPNTGCWLWTAARDRHGYGAVQAVAGEGRIGRAHRVVYEAVRGPVERKLDLDHKCRVRCCVNPDHLEPVTRKVNLSRGAGHGSETHCPHGHPYSPENTYLDDGARKCRECSRAKARRQKQKQREQRLAP